MSKKYRKIEEVTDEFWNNQMNEEDKQLIDAFLMQGHLADRTLEQYTSGIKIFSKWVYDHVIPLGKAKITDLKPRDALAYQNWLIKKGLSPSGIKFKRSVVSTFCGFVEVYYGDIYPDFRNIYSKAIPNVPKSAVKEKIPLTMEEINKIAKELTKKEDWQKLAFLWYSFATGCRREETRQLLAKVSTYEKEKEKDGTEKKFYRTHEIRAKGRGKEGNVRRFTFDDRAMEAIKKWLEYRSTQVESDDCPYVFVSKRNGKYQQITANAFNGWCNGFSNIIGGKKVHPHLIRTTRATTADEDGVDIKNIQSLLGHQSSETTQIYIVKEDEEDLDGLY